MSAVVVFDESERSVVVLCRVTDCPWRDVSLSRKGARALWDHHSFLFHECEPALWCDCGRPMADHRATQCRSCAARTRNLARH